MDLRQKAIEEVKRMNSKAENAHIINVHPEFFDGALYVVGFKVGEADFHNYVFVNSNGCHVSKNEALLLSLVSEKSKRSSFINSIGGIAGVIGLIVTLAIVYLVVREPNAEIPQVLSAALTTILGFYFGSKSYKP